jgi:type VI secretion system protein ImpH
MASVAAYGWRSTASVEEALYAEGYRFNFYQAVRLLETIHSQSAPVGEGARPNREPVRFTSKIRQDFPATDIEAIRSAQPNGPDEMDVNLMGIAGSLGPLPAPYTEWILDRLRDKDKAFRDFLDLFNHRLLSLLYRSRKVHRIGFDWRRPDQTSFAAYCFAVLGMGTSGLKSRLGLPDRALLPYAGLLAGHARSAAGLQCILADYFDASVSIRSFEGAWYDLAEDQLTAIGVTGRNQRLGQVVLGKRFWDQSAGFVIRIGPMSLGQFTDLSPDGDAFRSLCSLVRYYVGSDMTFEIELVLSKDEVPQFRLGDDQGAKLGWCSWLVSGVELSENQVVCVPLKLSF